MSDARNAAQKSCAVCGRNLLLGERSNAYYAPGGERVVVCELCKSRAEDAGWLRPDEVDLGREPGGRRRRRRSSAQLIGGLRARVERASETLGVSGADDAAIEEEGVRGVGEAPAGRPQRRRPARDRPARPPSSVEPAIAPAMRSTAGPDIVESLTAFNSSECRRTVSGLSKSLGEPLATAIAIRTASGDTGARITVAWELTWYQWEVGPGVRGPEIREIARGETVGQLRAADRNWNLDVSRDGTLARRPIGGPSE